LLRNVVRARAEWVLRWLLEKLKNEAEVGIQARRNTTVWLLLDWMVHTLPVSRSAPHLRDASFTTILERTLLENFDSDMAVQLEPTGGDEVMRDASESSETIQEVPSPSRKRKRGTNKSRPSKRAAVGYEHHKLLFSRVRHTVSSIIGLAGTNSKTHDITQNELMKMVLRTESAQASRILRFWLTAANKLLASEHSTSTPVRSSELYLDLSPILEVWESRVVSPSDEAGSSSEEFTTECLIPALVFVETLKSTRSSEPNQVPQRGTAATLQMLDKLLARHLFAPSRAAFFTDTNTESTSSVTYQEATALTSSLEPLRAKLLQATQMEDANHMIPTHLQCLFKSVAHLLDLAIRASPAKTPKSRLAERPWIQAVFVSLADCAGFSLKESPEFAATKVASDALGSALHILHVHVITMQAEILKKVYWYHCHLKHNGRRTEKVVWPLLAALIELDPSFFVTGHRAASSPTDAEATGTDLAGSIFNAIAHAETAGSSGFSDTVLSGAIDRDGQGVGKAVRNAKTAKDVVLQRIIIPMMSAFARNRNLLGFIRRWDEQLMKNVENSKDPAYGLPTIWRDRVLVTALADLFEQSLTQDQVVTLVQEHAERMNDLVSTMATRTKDSRPEIYKQPAYTKAISSAVIIPSLLQSIQSDETIYALKPHLLSLFASYTTGVQSDQFHAQIPLDLFWIALCQLTAKLWPIELHTSSQLQQTLLYPLIDRATTDSSSASRDGKGDSPARAAAMLFLLDACDRLQSVSSSKDLVHTSLQSVTESLSASQLEPEEHLKMIEIFLTFFAQLVGTQDSEAARESFLTLLSMLSKLEDDIGDFVGHALSYVSESDTSAVQGSYIAALSEALDYKDNDRMQEIAINAFIRVRPSALSRERRESILNRLTKLLCLGPHNATGLLSAMEQLMAIPNASATISTDGGIVFDIVDQLDAHNVRSDTVNQQLQGLVQKLLEHIVPNSSQVQSRIFMAEFMKRLNSIVSKPAKCSAAKLAILRATILEQKDTQLLSVKQYVELLKQSLTEDTSPEGSASLQDIFDSFNELPIHVLQEADLFEPTRDWLQIWINDNADLDSYLSLSGPTPLELAEYIARLHTTVAKYKLYPSVRWLIDLTRKVVREHITETVKTKAYQSVADSLASLSTAEKLDLVPFLTDVQKPSDEAASFRILERLISTMPDKPEDDAALKKKQFALLPRICVLLAESSDAECFSILIGNIDTILNLKTLLASQNGIECVVSVLVKLTSRTSPALPSTHAADIFASLCRMSRMLLLVHRSRLGGRSHLLLPLLQGLLFCLFVPASGRSGALPSWLRTASTTEHIQLTSANAAQYTRLLSTLCDPPQSSVSKHSKTSKTLNDPVKAAKEKASHFLYPLLASFCRFQLSGRLEQDVRKKLMPGIMEVVGTAALDREGLDAMFAGLGKSERDVWRGVWGEWEKQKGR
jgi:nucleolar pre-ribosomal-associated protein 2